MTLNLFRGAVPTPQAFDTPSRTSASRRTSVLPASSTTRASSGCPRYALFTHSSEHTPESSLSFFFFFCVAPQLTLTCPPSFLTAPPVSFTTGVFSQHRRPRFRQTRRPCQRPVACRSPRTFSTLRLQHVGYILFLCCTSSRTPRWSSWCVSDNSGGAHNLCFCASMPPPLFRPGVLTLGISLQRL